MTISAKAIADSISPKGVRLVTFELEYPRFIHGEFMTHRLFSRNAASSRAIPVERMLNLINENRAEPVHWGKNQPGMQAKEELAGEEKEGVQMLWHMAANKAVEFAKGMQQYGAHKQIVNRIVEPFQHIKVVVTATEYENFFHLRDHPDAQPEIRELAKEMKDAMDKSTPTLLTPGSWHVPYFKDGFWSEDEHSPILLEDALAISASCCAQVSYRKLDDTLEKARQIRERLIGDGSSPCHASPFEHQATPMDETGFLQKGVTHQGRTSYWSGNFRGWIQHRQLIPNHVKM